MTATVTAAAGRREWIGLAVLALPALLASLELTVTHLALPAIGADLAATSTQQFWIVDIYAFLLAGALITAGSLGDRIGRRRLLLVGAAAYGALSALAAFAPTAELLIAARAGLGLAGATLMPSTLALIAAMFRQPGQRAVAISILVSCISGGTAVGPLVGGWLLNQFWWGSVFLLGVPVMAALLLVGPILLPEHRDPGTGRLDATSAALTMAAVLPTVYGLKRIAVNGADPTPLLAVLAGVVFTAWFVRRQRRLDHPLVELRLFTNRTFTTAVATLAGGIFVLWALNFAVAQYLQLVHGLNPLTAGLWTAPSAAGVIAGSTIAPHLARRRGSGAVIGIGLVVSAAGFGMLATVDGLPVLIAGTVTVSAGLGPMMTLAIDQVITAAPADQAGMAAGISSAAPQLGGALGITVLGSIITAVYRHQMTAAVPPNVPPDVASTAQDNLTGAVASADQIGGSTLRAARDAFTDGLHLTAVISAVLMLTLAALVWRNLRFREPD